MKQALLDAGMDKMISLAVASNPDNMMSKTNLLEADKYVNNWHIMTYDFSSSSWGDKITSHQTNLMKTDYTPFSVDTAV